MKDFFKQFFNDHMSVEQAQADDEKRIRIAAAALMIEVAKADFAMEHDELERIEQILQTTLALDPEELLELIDLAQQESRDSTSLHAFTRLIHDEYTMEQKIRLFEQLWQVAYADGQLDKYEEYLLRKIADLIYLPHQHFVQSKLRVLEELGLG
ncbi:MAG: TerB family tellurite resistance protein [Gammaproteobacteria bacterium]|nr:TerB family tellurite resistance protein [Gammaproteobacteria bacterium]